MCLCKSAWSFFGCLLLSAAVLTTLFSGHLRPWHVATTQLPCLHHSHINFAQMPGSVSSALFIDFMLCSSHGQTYAIMTALLAECDDFIYWKPRRFLGQQGSAEDCLWSAGCDMGHCGCCQDLCHRAICWTCFWLDCWARSAWLAKIGRLFLFGPSCGCLHPCGSTLISSPPPLLRFPLLSRPPSPPRPPFPCHTHMRKWQIVVSRVTNVKLCPYDCMLCQKNTLWHKHLCITPVQVLVQ